MRCVALPLTTHRNAPARAAHRCVPHFSPALLQCNRRFTSSIVLGFVMHSAFYEFNKYISPFFGEFSITPHCANHVPKPIAISRQRRHFIHARLTPSRRRRHTCFAYVSIPFQRACRQCVHESARLSRVICSHAWYS